MQAEPLRDVFDVLAKEIPLHEGPDTIISSRHISSHSAALIKSHIRVLNEIVRNRVVLRMLQEMIIDDFPSSPQGFSQQTDTSRGNAFENGSGHLCV